MELVLCIDTCKIATSRVAHINSVLKGCLDAADMINIIRSNSSTKNQNTKKALLTVLVGALVGLLVGALVGLFVGDF